MAGDSTEASLKDRLQLNKYSRSACLAALRGETVPHALSPPIHRFCTIRGIRYNPGFGDELRGLLPIFTRALNARSIMSNVVPDIESPDEVPYCIWHPATASEETYRKLAQRYPNLAYQVGRACAVAGYAQLYYELDILPDVHIAEEARECGNLAIHDAIVSQALRFSIMNDYILSVDPDNRKPAYLNGDTAVRWMLDVKQGIGPYKTTASMLLADDDDDIFEELLDFRGYHDVMFNITEDFHVDQQDSDEATKRTFATRPSLQLLYEPLPTDLPTVQKDLLIAMAAYQGEVDRYARLRRPKLVYGENTCCVRGVYHNTFFAIWWSRQPDVDASIQTAVNAKFIMNNVLSRAPFPKHLTPYLIWWPTKAKESTYRHLYKLQPEMLPQIMRACIYCGYKDLFDELLTQVTPDKALIREAEEQGDLHFRQALEERVQSLGIDPPPPASDAGGWKTNMSRGFGISSVYVEKFLDANNIGYDWYAPYNGKQCDGSLVELNACLPDAWKTAADYEGDPRTLDYEEWPPKGTSASENE